MQFKIEAEQFIHFKSYSVMFIKFILLFNFSSIYYHVNLIIELFIYFCIYFGLWQFQSFIHSRINIDVTFDRCQIFFMTGQSSFGCIRRSCTLLDGWWCCYDSWLFIIKALIYLTQNFLLFTFLVSCLLFTCYWVKQSKTIWDIFALELSF